MTVTRDNTLFPILIKVWAGREKHDMRYIRRSLPSLLASGLPTEVRVILVNELREGGRTVSGRAVLRHLRR